MVRGPGQRGTSAPSLRRRPETRLPTSARPRREPHRRGSTAAARRAFARLGPAGRPADGEFPIGRL